MIHSLLYNCLNSSPPSIGKFFATSLAKVEWKLTPIHHGWSKASTSILINLDNISASKITSINSHWLFSRFCMIVWASSKYFSSQLYNVSYVLLITFLTLTPRPTISDRTAFFLLSTVLLLLSFTLYILSNILPRSIYKSDKCLWYSMSSSLQPIVVNLARSHQRFFFDHPKISPIFCSRSLSISRVSISSLTPIPDGRLGLSTKFARVDFSFMIIKNNCE